MSFLERQRRKLEEKIKKEIRERENACNVMMYAAAVCVMYYVCMYVCGFTEKWIEREIRCNATLHMNFLKRERENVCRSFWRL